MPRLPQKELSPPDPKEEEVTGAINVKLLEGRYAANTGGIYTIQMTGNMVSISSEDGQRQGQMLATATGRRLVMVSDAASYGDYSGGIIKWNNGAIMTKLPDEADTGKDPEVAALHAQACADAGAKVEKGSDEEPHTSPERSGNELFDFDVLDDAVPQSDPSSPRSKSPHRAPFPVPGRSGAAEIQENLPAGAKLVVVAPDAGAVAVADAAFAAKAAPPTSSAATDVIETHSKEQAAKDALMQRLREEGLLWRIIGGEDLGGIVVRTGEDLTAPKASPERISYGALVEQIALRDTRLHFRKITGEGPEEGWVLVLLERKNPLGEPWLKQLAMRELPDSDQEPT